MLPNARTVMHEEGMTLQGRENIGIFWPVWLLKKKSKPFNEDELDEYRGQKGLYLDETHGCPTGAITVEKLHTDSVKNQRELANNANEHREGQVASVYAAASSRLNFSAEADDAGAVTLHAPKKMKALDCSDSEDDFLGPVGNFRLRNHGQKPEKPQNPGEGEGTGSKKRKGGPAGSASSSTPQSTKGAKTKDKRAEKHLLELNECAKLQVEATQYLDMSCSSETFSMIKGGQILATEKKFEKRLAPGQVEILVTPVCGEDASKGKKCVLEMRVPTKKLMYYMYVPKQNWKVTIASTTTITIAITITTIINIYIAITITITIANYNHLPLRRSSARSQPWDPW